MTEGPATLWPPGERLLPVYSQGGIKGTRTGRGEIDVESRVHPVADAEIAARDEDGGSTRTEAFEQVTHSLHIFQREARLSDTIRYQTDSMRVARLVDSVFEPLLDRVVSAWV